MCTWIYCLRILLSNAKFIKSTNYRAWILCIQIIISDTNLINLSELNNPLQIKLDNKKTINIKFTFLNNSLLTAVKFIALVKAVIVIITHETQSNATQAVMTCKLRSAVTHFTQRINVYIDFKINVTKWDISFILFKIHFQIQFRIAKYVISIIQ